MDVSPEELSQLIGSIYDCVLDPGRWETVLAEIKDRLNCHNAVLTLTDTRYDRFLLYRSVGLSQELITAQEKHIPEINAQLSQVIAARPSLDEPFVLMRDASAEVRAASPYVQEALRPNGIVDIVQYFLIGAPRRFAGLALARGEPQPAFSDSDLRLGALLLPHMRRAVTISDVLDVRAIERSRFTAVLDALRCAVFLTDADSKLVYANRLAETMLREGAFIRSRQDKIKAVMPAAASELSAAIKLAALNDAEIDKTGLAIRLSPDDSSPVLAHVLPLGGTDFRSRLEPTAVAAIFIRNPEDMRDNAELIATTYGLTPAETRVLACLLSGRSLTEAAGELRISASTARTHLDAIFQKTGVSRQAELMLLVSKIAPPV